MRFLERPDLPAARVRLCVLSAGQADIKQELERLGIEALEVPPHPRLAEPVAAHADLQLRDLGGGQILAAPGCGGPIGELERQGFRVELLARPLAPDYPGDAALCCFALGGRLYANPVCAAPELLARYPRVWAVRQGYARCSVCIVDEGAILTADPGIATAAEAQGVAVLRLRPGHIALPGYGYGFIGGCAGLLAPDRLAFTGDVDTHPDGAAIRAFCRGRGVEILCLTKNPLLDIGGILPLLEM